MADVPTTFSKLDSVGVDGNAGRWAHAYALKKSADNLRYLGGRSLRRLVQLSWDAGPPENADALVVTPGQTWLMVIPPMQVHVGSTISNGRIRIYAKVENAKTARALVCSQGRHAGPFGNGEAAVLALAGDGTAKEYPTSGTYTVPLRPNDSGMDQIALLLRSDDKIDASPASGTVAMVFNDTLIAAAGTDWSALADTKDHYIRIEDAAGDVIMPERQVTAIRSATELTFWPPPPPDTWRLVNQTWRLYRGAEITFYAFAVYEDVPAVL